MNQPDAAIRLRLLGGASLENEHGPIGGRGAQRRRIALLSVLAMAQRPVSRDKIIGLLWEEHDTDRARKLLSESLYVIRKTVGDAAVVAAGDDLRLDPAAVWCDAVEFHNATEHGDDRSAVALYTGPFLDGFFIRGAPEFEKWLDGVRDTLARRQAESLVRLARASDAGSDAEAAVSWWRKLSDHDPYDGSYALGLMRALERTGQRGAALQHARAHATLLRSEFGADVDPSIDDLVQRLKEMPERPVEAGLHTPSEPAPAPTPGQPVEIDGTRRSIPQPVVVAPAPAGPRRRIPVLSIVTVVIVVGVIAGVIALLARRDAPVTSDAAATVVAVFPFDVHGDAADLREGMVDLLSTNLDGAGDLRSVDPHALLGHLDAGDAAPSIRQAAALTRRFGGALFVLGDVTQAGTQLQVNATLYATDESIVTRANARGPADSLLVLVDRIATQLVSARGISRDQLTQLAVMTTGSYPALKAYLEGESHYRAARYQAAASSFVRATAIDPGFALADYRLSASAEWSFDFLQARRAARRALENSARLPDHYRPLLRAWIHFLEGNATAGQREYEAILSTYPNDIEANSGLGEILVHFNATRGLPASAARAAFARVLTVAPAYGEVRFHEMEFAVRDRNVARFDSLLSGIDAANRHYLPWHAVRAFTWGTAADQDRVLHMLEDADEIVIGMAAGRVAAHAHNVAGARTIARLLARGTRTRQWQAGGRLLEAELEAAAGDITGARRTLAGAAALEPDWPIEIESLLLLHPSAQVTEEELEAQRAKLLEWSPGSHSPSTTFFLVAHATIHRHLREYLLGMYSVRLGRHEEAAAHRRALLQIRGDPDADRVGAALARSLEGHAARAQGDPARALELLSSASFDAPPEFLALSPFYSRAHDRYVMGALNAELGRSADARRWFASLLEGFDFMYAAPAHLALSQLAGANGDTQQQAVHMRAYEAITAGTITSGTTSSGTKKSQ